MMYILSIEYTIACTIIIFPFCFCFDFYLTSELRHMIIINLQLCLHEDTHCLVNNKIFSYNYIIIFICKITVSENAIKKTWTNLLGLYGHVII